MTEFIGVDLGATKILARFVDPVTGRTEQRLKRSTPRAGPAAVVDAVADIVERLDPDRSATAIGVGVPGLVTSEGIVTRCPNIDGWDDPIAVPEILSERLGRPVAVGNDVSVGALAEHRVGAGRGVADMATVFVGTGVGGGLILNDRLVAGRRGMAGEIGHITTHPGGRVCGCGRRGHLEAYAGRAGLAREARRLHAIGVENDLVRLAGDTGRIRSSHIAEALAAGDPVVTGLMHEAVEALAIGIGSVATLLDLDLVVLGGGVVDRLGEPFLRQIRRSKAFGGFGAAVCELRLAERLDDAGVVGAAILAADSFA